MMIVDLVKDVLSAYKWMPVEYCNDILGSKLIWQGQRDILESIVKNKRTTVPSGHSTGKSASAALITLWWLSTRYNSRVLVTAPTYRQLQAVYYAEVNKWYNQSMLKKFDMFNLKQNVMQINNNDLKKEWYMLPISPKTSDALQGQHGDKVQDVNKAMQELGIDEIKDNKDILDVIKKLKKGDISNSDDNLLVIIDEASGVDSEILEVLEGTDYTRLILFGNMTKNTGMFYDSVYRNNGTFNVIRLSSYDSPFMSYEQISHIENKYGKGSNVERVRLRGLAPDSENDTVISRDLLEKNINLVIDKEKLEDKYINSDIIELGVDVARFGDDTTVVYRREGHDIKDMITTSKKDTMNTVGIIANICNNNPDRTVRARVDGVGVGGGVIDRLRELQLSNLEILEVHNNGKPINEDEYKDWITEGFFELKEKLKEGLISIPDDGELIEELCGRKYKFHSDGRLVIESKADFKKRFKKSPDKADAFIQVWKNYDFITFY